MDAIEREPMDAVEQEPMDAIEWEPMDAVEREHKDSAEREPMDATERETIVCIGEHLVREPFMPMGAVSTEPKVVLGESKTVSVLKARVHF